MKSILIAVPAALLLIACAGGGAGGGYVASPRSTPPSALPLPEDPQLAAMLQRLAPEYQRWLANPAGYLITPATPQPWPCDVAQADQEKLGGVPVKMDEKSLAARAKYERDNGIKKGTLKAPWIERPQVYFLRGACSGGKLTGEIELLAEYVSVNSTLGNESRSQVRKLRRFKAVAGEAVGEQFTAEFMGLPQETKPSNAGIKMDMLSGNFHLGEIKPYQRGVAITYMRTESPKPLYGSWVNVDQSVILTQPIRGDRWKMIYYTGTSKTNEVQFKGDNMHGKLTSFAWSKTNPYGEEPLVFPAGVACYDEGELIMSVACDVN
jgi:hypothetical protein